MQDFGSRTKSREQIVNKHNFHIFCIIPRFLRLIDSYPLVAPLWRTIRRKQMTYDLDFDVEEYAQETDERWRQEKAQEARVIRARALLAQQGYRLMHRRNGQYWVMIDNPMTLDEIEACAMPTRRGR
jgi:hypothetical protein